MFNFNRKRKPGTANLYCFFVSLIWSRLPAASTIVLLSCIATAAQTSSQPPQSVNNLSTQLTLVQSSPLIIDPPADTQKGTIVIRNTTAGDVDMFLKTDVEFVNITTKTVMPAKVIFTLPIDDSPIKFKETVPSGKNTSVNIHVSNVQEEGEAEAPLINSLNGEQIGVLRISRTPFNVVLDVPLVVGENTQKLDFKHGTPTAMALKNNSPAYYKVNWLMTVNGVKYCGKDVSPDGLLVRVFSWFKSGRSDFCEKWKQEIIPPNERKIIEIDPPGEWFPDFIQSVLKNDVQNGNLRLSLEAFGDNERMRGTLSSAAKESPPEKEIPFTAHLSYFTPNTQLVFSTILIGFILLLGGLFSLLVRNWVPNLLRTQDIKEQLAKLAIKTGDLSSRLNSNLRVLVRVEPKRLTDLLKSRTVISPDLATVFTQCEKGMKSLERRVGILETIDSTYDRLDTLWASCPPPSLIDKVEQSLFKASQLLRSNEPSEIDFETARSLVAEAGLYCEKISASDDKFEEYLNTKITFLKSDFAADGFVGSTETCARIRKLLPGHFKILEEKRENKPPSKIASDDYTRLDISVLALTMIRDYVLLYENSLDSELRGKLDEREGGFIKHLGFQSREHLSKARSLLRQMREGIFTSDIQKAIENKEIVIEMDPLVAREQHPLRFAARFNRSELNDSAARDSFECIWDFGSARVPVVAGRFWSRTKANSANESEPALELPNSTKPAPVSTDKPASVVENNSPNIRLEENAERFIERGWAVSHYFIHNMKHHVTVWFEDETGKIVCDKPAKLKDETGKASENPGKLKLERSVMPVVDPSARSKDRLKTEGVSLAIVLVIALLGLVTGAREQVLKLDIVPGLVTVFLLGFSADAIKNLLTQRSS